MKEVLLLGDSIRMFYQKRVAEKLGADYNVSAPSENCRFVAYTFNSLRHWLPGFPKPDIIHWNNGLWDTGHFYGEEECGTSLPVYLEYLERCARVLLATGAKVIFATTTPCHPKKEYSTDGVSAIQRRSDVERYNKAACELMERLGIEVNDLFPIIADDVDNLICEDLVHPSEKGVEALAEAVSSKIVAYFDYKNQGTAEIKADTEEFYATVEEIK